MEFMIWEEESKRHNLSFFFQQPEQFVLLVGRNMKRGEISVFFHPQGARPKDYVLVRKIRVLYSCT